MSKKKKKILLVSPMTKTDFEKSCLYNTFFDLNNSLTFKLHWNGDLQQASDIFYSISWKERVSLVTPELKDRAGTNVS